MSVCVCVYVCWGEGGMVGGGGGGMVGGGRDGGKCSLHLPILTPLKCLLSLCRKKKKRMATSGTNFYYTYEKN